MHGQGWNQAPILAEFLPYQGQSSLPGYSRGRNDFREGVTKGPQSILVEDPWGQIYSPVCMYNCLFLNLQVQSLQQMLQVMEHYGNTANTCDLLTISKGILKVEPL